MRQPSLTYQLWREQADEQPPDLTSELMTTKNMDQPVSYTLGGSCLEPSAQWQIILRADARKVEVHDLPGAQRERHET